MKKVPYLKLAAYSESRGFSIKFMRQMVHKPDFPAFKEGRGDWWINADMADEYFESRVRHDDVVPVVTIDVQEVRLPIVNKQQAAADKRIAALKAKIKAKIKGVS